MASTIGIKVANGDFYPLVEENSAVKKRLVLTTVHDKQRSVQIDLYRSYTRTMADAQYVGSLVVENIKSRARGEPSIEMIISSTNDGEIAAEAVDLDAASGAQRQSLNVSLKTLDEDNRDYDLPDFDLEEPQELPPQGLYEKAGAIQKKEPRKFPVLVLILLVILLLIGGGIALWLLVFGGRIPAGIPFLSKPAASAPAVPAPPPRTPAAPVNPAVESPVVPAPIAPPPVFIQAPSAPVPEAPVNRARPAPPVASYRVPATIPRGGVAYKIRWGDTLWDISEAFYRNPWLYPRIARFNNIRNPDFIISGTTIRIPPRN